MFIVLLSQIGDAVRRYPSLCLSNFTGYSRLSFCGDNIQGTVKNCFTQTTQIRHPYFNVFDAVELFDLLHKAKFY